MALQEPYCTVAEADVYLVNSEIWTNATEEEKEDALFWGRTYIDSDYTCVEIDETDIPDEIKYGNALLAEDYLQGTLIDDGTEVDGNLTLKRVKAGSVETEKEYRPGAQPANAQEDVDILIKPYCTKHGSTSFILRM